MPKETIIHKNGIGSKVLEHLVNDGRAKELLNGKFQELYLLEKGAYVSIKKDPESQLKQEVTIESPDVSIYSYCVQMYDNYLKKVKKVA